MEGSSFSTTMFGLLFLIILPLRASPVNFNFNTGLIRFYNTTQTFRNMTQSQKYTYTVYPSVIPYTNLTTQNILFSLATFQYDRTSNLTCTLSTNSSYSFLLSCTQSVTSVSYLIFDQTNTVFVSSTSIDFSPSNQTNAVFDLTDVFKTSLPYQRYKYTAQLNGQAFLTNIQIYRNSTYLPISFISCQLIAPAKSTNTSLRNTYPYFNIMRSLDIKKISICYLLVLDNIIPFYWIFEDISIHSSPMLGNSTFGQFFGIKGLNLVNNYAASGVQNSTSINQSYLHSFSLYSNVSSPSSTQNMISVQRFNSSTILNYGLTSNLQLKVLSLKLISMNYCELYSTKYKSCVSSCDPTFQVLKSSTFNGIIYNYCTSLVQQVYPQNGFNSTNNTSNNSGSINNTNITNIQLCSNGYMPFKAQYDITPVCYCQLGTFMDSTGKCHPCQQNQVRCQSFLSMKGHITNIKNQQYIELFIKFSQIYSYLQNLQDQFKPIISINSAQYSPRINSSNWVDNYTLNVNLTDYPITSSYNISAYSKNSQNLIAKECILVQNQQTKDVFFARTNTNSVTLTRAAVSQVVVQTIQPYFNTVNSSSSTLILIAPILGQKMSIFSLLQTNSLLYCINFLKITNQSQYKYQKLLSIVNSLFIFQTQPLFKLFGDKQLIDIANQSDIQNQILSEFQSSKIKQLKDQHTFFQNSINQVIFLLTQVVLMQVLIFLMSFKLCHLIGKISGSRQSKYLINEDRKQRTVKDSEMKQEDSMKVISLQESTQNNFQSKNESQQDYNLKKQQNKLLKYKFDFYTFRQNQTIKWLPKVHLDEQLASLKHTLVFYSYQLNSKKYIFYTSYIISQLISQFILAYYQLISPIITIQNAFQLLYSTIIVFLLIIYPMLMINYNCLFLLKIVQIIYKFNGYIQKSSTSQKFITNTSPLTSNIQKQVSKQYRHSQIFNYFLIIYFENLVFALCILLGRSVVYQTLPIALLFTLKLIYMKNKIKTIDFWKTLLLISLFTILGVISMSQINLYTDQIQELMIYMTMTIAALQYMKLFKIIVIGFVTFFKKKIQAILKKNKVEQDKILKHQSRIQNAHKKLQKIKQLKNLKESLNDQLYILRKSNQKRKNDQLSQQLKIITTSGEPKKPEMLEGLEQIIEYQKTPQQTIQKIEINNKKIKEPKQQVSEKSDINDLVKRYSNEKNNLGQIIAKI